jgi:hypothetical protein
MHDEAILERGSGRVAPNGALVTIDAVAKVYSTSAAVKGHEKFKCADKRCRVAVLAVITAAVKAGRKKSPSSYFRASPKKHVTGCTRRHTEDEVPTQSLTGTNAARPNKASVPTRWIEPNVAPAGGTTVVDEDVAPELDGDGTGRGRTRTGSGTSISSSMRVEKFAGAWLDMTPNTRASTELNAAWNPGGTFESAFWVLADSMLPHGDASPKRIFRGALREIQLGTSGYTLKLVERDSEDVELWVWVQKATKESNASGRVLWERLETGKVVIGSDVFALGHFVRTTRPNKEWQSLAIDNGHLIWVS